MSESQEKSVGGGCEGVGGCTTDSGHRLPLLSVSVSYYPMHCHPCKVTPPFLEMCAWS